VRQLRQSGLIGLWKNRDDIIDSAVYARQLRKQAQQLLRISVNVIKLSKKSNACLSRLVALK